MAVLPCREEIFRFIAAMTSPLFVATLARRRWFLLACFCSLTPARRDDDIVEAKSSDAARETGDDDGALDASDRAIDRWQHRDLLRAGRRRRWLQPAAQEPARARDLLLRAPGAPGGVAGASIEALRRLEFSTKTCRCGLERSDLAVDVGG